MTCSAAPSVSRLLTTKSTFIWIPLSGRRAQLRPRAIGQENGAALRAAVEQEVDRGEPGNEGLGTALLVCGMRELVPLDAHAFARKRLCVEIAPRTAESGEQTVGAHCPAQLKDELGFRALRTELAAAHE